jgi:DNA-binding NarL/FixJ family response regulator
MIGIGQMVFDGTFISSYETEMIKTERMKILFRAEDFSDFRTMMVLSKPPDIVIVYLPSWTDHAFNFASTMKVIGPIKTLLVVGQHEKGAVIEAIRKGAKGYLSNGSFNTIVEAVDQVVGFGGYISKGVIEDFIGQLQHSVQYELQLTLTSREKEIVQLLCQGLTYKQIAEKSYITSFAVNQHLKKIYVKMGVHSKGELIAKMLK